MKKILLIVVTVLFVLFIFFFWGGSVFTKISIENKIEELRDSTNFKSKELFTYQSLEDQPILIQSFFKKVLPDNIYKPNFVTIKQTAEIKTDVHSDWIPLKSNQYFTTKKPNYIWNSVMQNSKYFWVNSIESYTGNKGNMLIKLNSSITIGDSWGIELDKSGLFQYILGAVFFPTTLLPNENLFWNILDTNTAEIKFTNNELSVVAKLFFNEDYTISKIETFDKYRALESGYEKSLYTIYFSDYKNLENGYLVPKYFELEWDLKDGKFKYGKFTINDIIYE
ncbi:MAG: hypothetical protein H6609_00820 [Ignavibacteriales bacterium]|nr:hypothetical protein [Ignavibacteriales bacterium]